MADILRDGHRLSSPFSEVLSQYLVRYLKEGNIDAPISIKELEKMTKIQKHFSEPIHSVKLQVEILKKLEKHRDTVSIMKLVKICSQCDLDFNSKLKAHIVETLNQGGKLNGLPLDITYFKRYGLPFVA